MATPAQILANHANAQHSTGPKTETGKAASAANSTKHGLSSAFAVLPHEDQSEFDGLLTNLSAEHKPATGHQRFLVAQLAKTWWLLARAQRLQNKAFEHLAGLESDPEDLDARIVAQMFKTNPNALTSLQRYATHAEVPITKLGASSRPASKSKTKPIASRASPLRPQPASSTGSWRLRCPTTRPTALNRQPLNTDTFREPAPPFSRSGPPRRRTDPQSEQSVVLPVTSAALTPVSAASGTRSLTS